MKIFSGLAAILLTLTLTAPAWALDFGTSTFATWSFSGAAVEVIEGPVSTSRLSVYNPEIGAASESLPLLTVPGVGTAQSTGTNSHVFASADVMGPESHSYAETFHSLFVIPQVVGLTTLTVTYQFDQQGTGGVNATDTPFPTRLQVQGLDGSNQTTVFPTVGLAHSTGSFTRNLSFSGIGQDFAAGLSFQAIASASAQSVPVPGMLWPTAAGLVGMAWIMARRRTHAA